MFVVLCLAFFYSKIFFVFFFKRGRGLYSTPRLCFPRLYRFSVPPLFVRWPWCSFNQFWRPRLLAHFLLLAPSVAFISFLNKDNSLLSFLFQNSVFRPLCRCSLSFFSLIFSGLLPLLFFCLSRLRLCHPVQFIPSVVLLPANSRLADVHKPRL